MARKIIDIGAVGNDGTGDSIRDSFGKVNDNFLELYSSLGLGERLKFTGLSDAPSSYVGQEGALVTVNQTTTGLKFKQLVPGVGITVDQTTNPNEIKLNAVFSAISADKNPQLGGNLSAISGGQQYKILDLQTPTSSGEVSNKAYTDTKIGRGGVDSIDPATGQTNAAFGRMTGPLILSRNPIPEDDTVFDGLIAATKSYVDSSAFGSVANLYVATSGADARPGVSDELQGRALAYAYRTVEAALKRAEELVLESRVEIGPYKKTLTYNNGAGVCTLSNISTSVDSGAGFVGAALMSIDTITISAPGSNYWVGDIITLTGGTVAPGGQPATLQVLSTASTPGSLLTFKILSSGVYSAIPGALDVASTATNPDKITYGAGAKFNITYKVNNVTVSNGGTNFGLVSVRITGGGGEGAFGTANVVNGVIQSVTVTDPGAGFTSVPTVVADLPTFAIYTAGKKTDFTGNYSTNTLGAVATRDIRPGLYLRGETSGALAQILTHTGDLDANGNELFDVDIKYGSFLIGESISYGDITKNIQITIFVESGIYEENYPLKVSQNVSLIGDEFRRVLIKPKLGPSSSPWAFDLFRRDQTIDGMTVSDGLFRRHYLTDTGSPVYPLISNAGNYKAAAKLLALNKTWFQEEIIAWIDAQIAAKAEPFDGGFSFNTDKCSRDVGLILNAVLADTILGTTHLTVTAGNAYLRSYSSNVTSYQKGQTIAGIKKARELALNLIYGSSTYVQSSQSIKTLIDKIIYIIDSGVPATDVTYTNPNGISTDRSRAAAILKANTAFIKSEVTGYINDSLTPASIPGYDANTCARDVGFIVDGMLFDLIYGGTTETINTGLAYYNGTLTTVGGESAAFTSVLNQLKIIIPQVISNSTTWANKSVSNTTAQVTNLTAASSSGDAATALTSAFDIIKDIVVNGPTATSAQNPVAPTYTNGVNYNLNSDRTTIQAGLTTLEASVIAYLNATYSPGTFTYNYKLCKRDIGLIVDALVFDLRYGGYNRSISAALKYFQSASALKAITDQLDQTVATWQHLITLATAVLSNTKISSPAQTLLPQIIDNAFIAEVGTSNIVANLINGIIDIISGSTAVNFPKDNNKIDVFMMNDATMLRRMTAQGHGGFMMILDPAGQILAKSPYCQESASFIGSTGRKQFAGGMFVDGFAGNLEFNMVSAVNTTRISISGLQRFPNLPASVIISDSVYRINYIRDWVYNATGSSATMVLDPSTPYIFDVGPQTCTISNSTPVTITKTNHNLQAGATITFSTTGTLPTGLTVGKRYYVLLTNLGANSFQITDTIGSIVPVATSSAGSGTHKYNRVYELLMPGNRSMLSNDYTQVADLGYGIVVTNGGLTEAVSMFTYYCQISYYSINGGQIRSIAGSSAHGNYALVAEGSDPLEVPTPTDLYYDLAQPVSCYYPSGTYSNSAQGVIIYINNYRYVPLPNSELEIDHGSGVLYRYPVNSAYTGSDLPAGVARLTLGSTTGASGLSGLYAQVADGTLMTIRQSQTLMLTGNLSGVAVRPSTGLVFTESSVNVYRVLQFTDYTDPSGPYTCTISNASPAVVTKANHGLLADYTITFSSTGTLPVGITAGQTYYVLGTGLTQNTFQFSLLKGGGAVNTSSAGSGTFSYIPTGITSTLLRENYQYIPMTVYTPNDYATVETTATATAVVTASMTGSAISGTTLTVGTLASGTISAGMLLTGTNVVSGTYIVANISGSGNGSTWTVSVSQTVSSTTITGTSYQVTVGSSTGMNVNNPIKFGISTTATASDANTNYITVGSTLGMVANMPLLFSVVGGSAFGNLVANTVYYVSSVISGTQITVSATQGGSVFTVTSSSGSMIVTTSGTFGGITAGQNYYVGSVPASGKVTLSSTPHVTTTATSTAITTASFTGSISGTTLTVTNVASGTVGPGMVITGGTIAANTYIVSGTGTSFTVSSSQTVSSTSISGTAYTVTVSNSGLLSIGQPIVFTGTGFGNIVSNTQYYVAAIQSSTSISLSASSALTSLFALTNASGSIPGVGKHTPVVLTAATGSISAIQSGGNTVTMTAATPAVFTTAYAHGFVAGDVIKLETTGTLPTGLATSGHYFVISTGLTTTSFQISSSPGGTAVNTSGTVNSGTHTVSKVKGRAGDSWFAVVALGPYDRSRVVGSIFNWKGIDYVVTRYDPETVTNTAFGRIYVSQINLTTGVQSGVGLNDSVVSYVSAITLKAGVRRGSANAEGTLTIRIALTRVTGHDLLDIGTGSYADTNYPNEIYGPAVNARNPAGETVERSVGRVFYVTTDQYGNFRVGPYFSVDQGTGKVSFSAAIALSNLDGLGFKRGVPISEFSTDSSFANNATDTVPTQNATRIYIERRLGLTHNGSAVDAGQLIPITTGGFLALNGSLKMKGNLDINFNKLVNLSDPTNPQDAVNLRSMTFANFQDFSGSSISSAQILAFTGSSYGAVNATLAGDATLTLSGRTLTATISSGAIVNSKVSASAAIDQSKLNMNAATTRTNATGITQGNLGLASFDDLIFSSSSGWITIKTNSLSPANFNQIAANTVLGNSSISTGNISAVAFSTVVDTGGAIKKGQYSSTGFLRRTGGTGTADGDFSIVEMSAAYTGSADNGKLVNRDSSGNFAANEVTVSKLIVDNNTSVDTATAGTGGYIRYYGYNTVGGILVQSGSAATDNKTLYWNDSHQFKTKDGGTDAPIYASSIQVQAITTGGNTTSGTITGRWTLTGSSPNESRLQATYSADLAEYYEGDKEYEVGTVLVFGGEKEVTVEGKLANTRVAGVVSNTAAFVMYDACPGFKNLVALQGRVPVKVVGKIQKGDLLVTSKIPGVAVSAGEDAKTGTVLGKALETYDSDHIGTIEVAVGRS